MALGCITVGIVLVVGIMGLLYVGLTSSTPSESIPSRVPETAQPSGPGSLPAASPPAASLPAAASADHGATGSASLSGTDDQTGPPFVLSGGDSIVTWAATSTNDASNASRFVVSIGNPASQIATWSVTTDVPGGKERSGAEDAYGLPGGEYHFKVNTTHATWQVSIAPR